MSAAAAAITFRRKFDEPSSTHDELYIIVCICLLELGQKIKELFGRYAAANFEK
jgi:hypothetical protein